MGRTRHDDGEQVARLAPQRVAQRRESAERTARARPFLSTDRFASVMPGRAVSPCPSMFANTTPIKPNGKAMS
jgi:hypothetical protein